MEGTADAPAPAGGVLPPVNEALLALVVELGFDATRSRKALLAGCASMEQACEWLIEHDEDPGIDDPIPLVPPPGFAPVAAAAAPVLVAAAAVDAPPAAAEATAVAAAAAAPEVAAPDVQPQPLAGSSALPTAITAALPTALSAAVAAAAAASAPAAATLPALAAAAAPAASAARSPVASPSPAEADEDEDEERLPPVNEAILAEILNFGFPEVLPARTRRVP